MSLASPVLAGEFFTTEPPGRPQRAEMMLNILQGTEQPPTAKGCLVQSVNSAAVIYPKAVVSPVVMYGCESWTVKKAER